MSLFCSSVCVAASVLSFSCASKPTDLRTLVPADALVYLQTNDLANALEPINMNAKPDLSALRGVQVAVAVMGIESSEHPVTGEQSTAEIKLKFVAVVETHAWHFQAVRFAEDKLGGIVERAYGSKPQMQDPERRGGRDITWTAADGRSSYAFVTGGTVYFSDDRETLDKALAVRDGSPDLASTNRVEDTPAGALASGYAGSNGVAQIADLMALSAARASDDPGVRSGVATILPRLVRELVVDVSWVETRAQDGVTDTYQMNMPGNILAALSDTQPGELNERVRNTVLKLLADDRSSPASKLETAEIVARAIQVGDTTQNGFTPTGVVQSRTARSGLLESVIRLIGDPTGGG